MDFKHLYIKYCNPSNNLDSFTLQYQLRDNSVVPKWCERIESAQKKYTIDDPNRFYGFGSLRDQEQDALTRINNVIDIINDFESIIDRKLQSIQDQDTLNYLHHIFEEYHGLLDQQTHEFWQRAPDLVRKSLANLNIFVHRCESVRELKPRHVITYFGLPKTEILDQLDFEYFEDCVKFGTVYLNYVEIGKTLEDLANDNDQYIGDDAFQQFNHYSADFNVKFWDDAPEQIELKRDKIKHYYDKHKDFFVKRNIPWNHYSLKSGNIPLADLKYKGSKKELLKKLESHQQVAEVILL
jgi:hypothetical protein